LTAFIERLNGCYASTLTSLVAWILASYPDGELTLRRSCPTMAVLTWFKFCSSERSA